MIKQNPNYILREIHNIPYLLPIGQMVAEHRKGVQLNETGAYLWSLLSTERSMEELFDQCARRFEVPDSEVPEMRSHICQFTEALIQKGFLLTASSFIATGAPLYKCINIAGLSIALHGPEAAFSDKFDMFSVQTNLPVQPAELPGKSVEVYPHSPYKTENGRMLLRSDELCVMEYENKFILFFPTMKQVKEVHIDKNASSAKIYCTADYDDDFRENLFHVLRHIFLYMAQQHGMFALHSASILYKDKAWLFAAPTGIGKSTHANLWKEYIHTPILNGDLNLLAFKDGVPVIHGTPWCGTSGICTRETYPVGGIILLRQSDINTVVPLSEDQTVLQVCNRLISPLWTAGQLDCNLTFTEAFTDKIMVRKLLCTRDKEALDVIKNEIDANL